jgi:hypothetical protein
MKWGRFASAVVLTLVAAAEARAQGATDAPEAIERQSRVGEALTRSDGMAISRSLQGIALVMRLAGIVPVAAPQPPRDPPPRRDPSGPRPGTGSIFGQVFLSSGDSVSDAEVAISSASARTITSLRAHGTFEFSAQPASRYNLSAPASVTWLIFVDDLHIDFRDTGYLRNLLRSIATELIRDGESFIVRSSGPSTLSVALNSNRAVLDASISKATGNELSRGDCLGGETDDEIRYRAQLAGTAAAEMLNRLPKNTSGSVALLYISDG